MLSHFCVLIFTIVSLLSSEQKEKKGEKGRKEKRKKSRERGWFMENGRIREKGED